MCRHGGVRRLKIAPLPPGGGGCLKPEARRPEGVARPSRKCLRQERGEGKRAAFSPPPDPVPAPPPTRAAPAPTPPSPPTPPSLRPPAHCSPFTNPHCLLRPPVAEPTPTPTPTPTCACAAAAAPHPSVHFSSPKGEGGAQCLFYRHLVRHAPPTPLLLALTPPPHPPHPTPPHPPGAFVAPVPSPPCC